MMTLLTFYTFMISNWRSICLTGYGYPGYGIEGNGFVDKTGFVGLSFHDTNIVNKLHSLTNIVLDTHMNTWQAVTDM